jgi:hypothetical protein
MYSGLLGAVLLVPFAKERKNSLEMGTEALILRIQEDG